MANDRALGVSYIYAAQTWRQLVLLYGEHRGLALFGLTNVVIAFGGGKDGDFYRELSELIGRTRVRRSSYSYRGVWARSTQRRGHPVLRPEEIRLVPPGRALVLAENAPPLMARLTQPHGAPGRRALGAQAAARDRARLARGRGTGEGAPAATRGDG